LGLNKLTNNNNSGAVEHAKNSISMADLYSAGKVTRLDDTISKDVMKYFNVTAQA